MGRKIPGRKHRGVKDPEKQAAARLDSIKDKINAPPLNPEIQEISKALERIIHLKNQAKSGEFNAKPKKKSKTTKISDEDKLKPNKGKVKTSPFQQLASESNRQFLFRVNKICQKVTKEAAFEDKYRVQIKRNNAGEVESVVKRPKDELEKLLKNARKEKAQTTKNKKKKVEDETPKLTKSQKWQIKKKEKKLKKKTKSQEEFGNQVDPVKFGEVVHAPPTLTAPKKVQKVTSQPGHKNLLLSAIIEENDKKSKGKASTEKNSGVAKKTIDKKGKRKDLPNALRRQLDNQQKEVIGAYKTLKAKKYN